MAGKFTSIQYLHLLTLCILATQFALATQEIHVVNVPSDNDDIEKFLNSESQHISKESNNLSSMDSRNDESNEEFSEQPVEHLFVDDTRPVKHGSNFSEEATTTEMAPNATENEDVWIVEMSSDAKITQYFLNKERKSIEEMYGELDPMNETNEIHVQAPIDKDTNQESVSVNSTYENNVNVIQNSDGKLNQERDPYIELMHTFLSKERQRSEFDNSPIQNVEFITTSEKQVSSSNVNLCGTVNLNKIVDEVINDLRIDIVEKGLDKIKIPDIHEIFKRKVGIISVTGDFNAEHGWAKNLSTIERTADVIASAQGNSITIACGFGLSELQFGYDQYKANFMNFGPKGKIDAVIAENSLLLNATVSWNNHTCTTALNFLSLNEFGGFKLRITGLGPLNFLVTKISDWAFQKFRVQIKEKVETTLKDIIEKQLQTFDCTKYIFKLALNEFRT